jgi:eukaryotic-like serine/threonine-protein kinase
MKRTRDERRDDGALEMGGLIIHPGQRIGSYIFLREIGSGGMARVLLAKDPNGDLVALKVLRKSRFRTGLVRFRREFRALSRVNHPNVIHVEAYGDLHGHPYIAMEYVDGPDLHSLIRSFRGWDPEKRFARCESILVDLCRALSAIHRRGLVHRDLKPSNVLITRDSSCKLTDFGIVKDLDPSHDPHMSTTLVGTWAYASPEQITGNPIDHRSDLYSLGVILFAMLTGKRPFVANDMAGYLALHRDRPAPAPHDVNRAVPAHFDEICRRLLQKAPRDRFQSAQEILYRLEAEDKPAEPSGDDAWQPPLVGRALEIDALQDAVAALTRQEGSVVVLEGDDGCGKSRLLDVVAERAKMIGIPHHRLELSSDKPVFSPSMRLARDLIQELGRKAPRSVREDIDAYSEAAPPRGNARYALYDALRELLTVAMDDQPRVLLLDDLHEANGREVDLFGFLARTLIQKGRLPLLIVATLRPKASPAADAFASGEGLELDPREITVGALQREDLMEIVFEQVGDTLGSRLLAQRLHKETEGNPYFITEFLRSLVARKVIREVDGVHQLVLEAEEVAQDHLEIPPGVRQMMKSRLEGVKALDRTVLEVLSVGGRDMDLDVLLDVLDLDEEDVLDALDRLIKAGIVRERRSGETVLHTVTHRKFADVVYRDLTPERRANMHRKMAAALELHYAQNPAALEVVGEHYRRAGDAGRAYRYLVAAAKRLADRSLMQEAWDLTEKAGTLEDSAMGDLSPDDFRAFRLDNLTVRAQVHYNRAQWAEADRAYRAALTLAEESGDPRTACEARLKLATVLRRRGRHADSKIFAEQALEASRRLHYRQGVADALHCMAALAWAEGSLEDCERMANEGLLVAQGNQLADRRAELLLALTAAQATRGALASATMGLTEAEGIFRELRMKRPRCLALSNIAELLTWQGEPMQARQRAHVAVQLGTELDYKLGRTAATRAMAVAALDLGRYEEASDGLREALAMAHEINLPEEILACQVGLAQLALERDDYETARLHAAAGLEVADSRDPERYTPLLRAHLAAALAPNKPGDARTLVKAAETSLEELPVPRRTQVQLALTWANYLLEDYTAARTLGQRVVQIAGSRGFRLLLLEARALLAQVTVDKEQENHRNVGQELARDFTASLSPELALSFMQRPFLKFLDDPAAELPDT